MGGRLRRAVAHRLQDAGRAAVGVGGQGAAGPDRGLAAEHHQPPRASSRRAATRAEAGERTAAPGTPVRKDFRVLAFWLGSVVTDASGRGADGGHAAREPDHVPHHGGGGGQGVAVRRRRARDPHQQARPAARRLPALPGPAATPRASAPSCTASSRTRARPSSPCAASIRPCSRSWATRSRRCPWRAAAPARSASTCARAPVGRARVQMTAKLLGETRRVRGDGPGRGARLAGGGGRLRADAGRGARDPRAARGRRARLRRPARRDRVHRARGPRAKARATSSSTRTAAPSSGPRPRSRWPWPRTSATPSACPASMPAKLEGGGGRDASRSSKAFQCADGGFAFWKGECRTRVALSDELRRRTSCSAGRPSAIAVDPGGAGARLHVPRGGARRRRGRRTRAGGRPTRPGRPSR